MSSKSPSEESRLNGVRLSAIKYEQNVSMVVKMHGPTSALRSPEQAAKSERHEQLLAPHRERTLEAAERYGLDITPFRWPLSKLARDEASLKRLRELCLTVAEEAEAEMKYGPPAATATGDTAKLRKLGDILDGWVTAYVRAPRAELAKLPMLFGNDAIVTVIQREAGEPIREQLEELNELRLTLDNATDDELAEVVTVDPPRWAKASPPQTRTREDDLRQKVSGEASHLSMIVRHAAEAMEAKTPAAPEGGGGAARSTPGNGEPLTDTEAAVYAVIPEAPDAITGKEIAAKHGIGILQSTLTKHIIPKLKMKRGIVNRGAGYFRPPT